MLDTVQLLDSRHGALLQSIMGEIERWGWGECQLILARGFKPGPCQPNDSGSPTNDMEAVGRKSLVLLWKGGNTSLLRVATGFMCLGIAICHDTLEAL